LNDWSASRITAGRLCDWPWGWRTGRDRWCMMMARRSRQAGHCSSRPVIEGQGRSVVVRLVIGHSMYAFSKFKKISYCRGITQHALLVNSCHVWRDIGVRKLSNS